MGPHGLTGRNKVFKAGYTFLENKYYLDHLYTDVVAGGTKGPLARASYWVNMNVLDGIVDGTAAVFRKLSGLTYRFVDQGVVDGVVNGSGFVSEESGQLLRRIQTGKVQQYGALLFAGATVLAGVFVFVL
jgi:NADH-quinone oxidoreductase subunit L